MMMILMKKITIIIKVQKPNIKFSCKNKAKPIKRLNLPTSKKKKTKIKMVD